MVSPPSADGLTGVQAPHGRAQATLGVQQNRQSLEEQMARDHRTSHLTLLDNPGGSDCLTLAILRSSNPTEPDHQLSIKAQQCREFLLSELPGYFQSLDEKGEVFFNPNAYLDLNDSPRLLNTLLQFLFGDDRPQVNIISSQAEDGLLMQTVGEPNPRLASITLTDSAGHYRAAVPRLWLGMPLAPLPNFSDEQGMLLASAANVDASQPGSSAPMSSFGGHALQLSQTPLIDAENQTEPGSADWQNTSPSGRNFEFDPQALTAALAAVPRENSRDMTAAPPRGRTRRGGTVSDEDKAEILRLHKENFSQVKIAENLKISKYLVSTVINTNKVGPPKEGVMTPKGTRISDYAKDWILKLHNGPEPLTHQEIGEIVGLCKSTVKKVIDASKVVLQAGMMTPNGKHANERAKAQILDLYNNDKTKRLSALDIAKEVGVTIDKVRSVIHISQVGTPLEGMRTPNGKNLSRDGEARILRRHGDPDKPSEQKIARELGVPKSTVGGVLRRANKTAQRNVGNNASADTGAQAAPVGMPPQTSA